MNYSKKPEGLHHDNEDFFSYLDRVEPDRWEDEPPTEAWISAVLDGLGHEPPVSKRITNFINSLPEKIAARLPKIAASPDNDVSEIVADPLLPRQAGESSK